MIDKMDLSHKAFSIRKKLGESDSSPIDIFSLALTIDKLTLVFYPLGENISGACIQGKESSIIAINSEMSIGRQRFSLAHELYHLYFNTETKTNICSNIIGNGDENERKADQFASYFLMPANALYEIVEKVKAKKRFLSIEDIIRIEQYFGVSHKAMLNRLAEDKLITKRQMEEMQQGVMSYASRMGLDVSLYLPSPEDRKMLTLGYYITQTEKIYGEDRVSTGKYEELLLSAFRSDIVYGSDQLGRTEIAD